MSRGSIMSVLWVAGISVWPACDDGGVETLDSGIRVNRDSAAADTAEPTPDTSRDTSVPPDDAGMSDIDGACTVAGPIEPFGESCAGATFDCIAGCMDGACQMACIEADPDPPICLNCVLGNLTSCAQEHGCQDEWDAYYCCVEAAGCFDLEAEAARVCSTMSCLMPFSAYQDCASPLQMECFPVQRMCFPP